VLVEDKRSASGYKNVRNAAVAYNKAASDEEAAQALSLLVVAAIEYVRTWTSSSYEDRKDNCNAFLEEYKEFSVISGAEYVSRFAVNVLEASKDAVRHKNADPDDNLYALRISLEY
jgi:hypothetical protein